MSKTIPVTKIKQIANSLLSNKNLNDEERKGIAVFLERILFETNTYGGFGFVEWLDEGGFERWRADGQPKDNSPYLGNETRRIYY